MLPVPSRLNLIIELTPLRFLSFQAISFSSESSVLLYLDWIVDLPSYMTQCCIVYLETILTGEGALPVFFGDYHFCPYLSHLIFFSWNSDFIPARLLLTYSSETFYHALSFYFKIKTVKSIAFGGNYWVNNCA